MKSLADECFDNDIFRGLLRRSPGFDLVRTQNTPEIAGHDDETLLTWAANHERAVLMHDLATMVSALGVQRQPPLTAIVLVPDLPPIGRVIEDVLPERCSKESEWIAGFNFTCRRDRAEAVLKCANFAAMVVALASESSSIAVVGTRRNSLWAKQLEPFLQERPMRSPQLITWRAALPVGKDGITSVVFSWLPKALPIAAGLAFLAGREAVSWRDALFRVQLPTASEFHDVLALGFSAAYNEVLTPLALMIAFACGGLLALARLTNGSKIGAAQLLARIDRHRCTWKALRHASSSVCCFGLLWRRLLRRGVKQKLSFSAFWNPTSPLPWLAIYFFSYWTSFLACTSIQPTLKTLQSAAEGTVKNALQNKAFESLILQGFPLSFLWSALLLIVAWIATFKLVQLSDTRVKHIVCLVPAYAISHWLLVALPALAGFELARQPCPKIRFAKGAKDLAPSMLTSGNRCYLLLDAPSREIFLVAPPEERTDPDLPNVFSIPKANVPSYVIESREDVLKALVVNKRSKNMSVCERCRGYPPLFRTRRCRIHFAHPENSIADLL